MRYNHDFETNSPINISAHLSDFKLTRANGSSYHRFSDKSSLSRLCVTCKWDLTPTPYCSVGIAYNNSELMKFKLGGHEEYSPQ